MIPPLARVRMEGKWVLLGVSKKKGLQEKLKETEDRLYHIIILHFEGGMGPKYLIYKGRTMWLFLVGFFPNHFLV